MIRIEVLGTDRVIAYFQKASDRQKKGTVEAMTAIGKRVLEEVQANLSGGMLKSQSGTLLRAQEVRVEEEASKVSVFVGFDADKAPYGKFLLEGVGHDWLIQAVNAKALKFQINGEDVFAKHVTHPPFPPKSFLADALAKVQPEIMPTLRAAINA
jgi:phage protein D